MQISKQILMKCVEVFILSGKKRCGHGKNAVTFFLFHNLGATKGWVKSVVITRCDSIIKGVVLGKMLWGIFRKIY